jgi:hypothetical protein
VNTTDQHRSAFYTAAGFGLRFLDCAGQARRFGPDADAHWRAFAGHLGIRDRLDFLLRDASVTWDAAFSPARVFRLPGLAPDEPFGPDWASLAEDQAQRLWAKLAAIDGDLETVLTAILDALELADAATSAPTADTLADLTPATRLLVCGVGALVATARAFRDREDLSWSDQVLALADTPAERHLAGMLAVLLNARGPTKLLATTDLSADDPRAALRAAGLPTVDRTVTSGTLDPATSETLAKVVG